MVENSLGLPTLRISYAFVGNTEHPCSRCPVNIDRGTVWVYRLGNIVQPRTNAVKNLRVQSLMLPYPHRPVGQYVDHADEREEVQQGRTDLAFRGLFDNNYRVHRFFVHFSLLQLIVARCRYRDYLFAAPEGSGFRRYTRQA